MRIIQIWHEKAEKWFDYTLEELEESFRFVSKPKWNLVERAYYHNSGFNSWLEIVYPNGSSKIYNKDGNSGAFVGQ
jgi:hypothetical protein